MLTRTNIAYTTQSDDASRQFDIHFHESGTTSSTTPSPLICFVHGGAWRSEDKQDHAALARKLSAATGFPVAIPNYRLTPPANNNPAYRHPMHAQDLLDFLRFILDWKVSGSAYYDPSRLVLIGHSCAAHMLSSIFLESREQSLEPSSRLLDSVKLIILSEGIYDIALLLESFPAYREWFIEPAFGPFESYSQVSATKYNFRPLSSFRWILLHSKGDSLVDMKQTVAMYDHLKSLDCACVEVDTDELKGGHDEILGTDSYVSLVKKYIGKISSM